MSSAARHANPPSATITRTSEPISRHSASSHGAHVARSSGVGALPGGAQRTAAATRVSLSVNPSAASTHAAWLASPARCSAANRKSPRPVAGEHPAGAVGAVRGGRQTDDHHPRPRRPQPGIGRPQYGSSANDLRLTTATSSRHSTSRGHARHTDTSASSSSTVPTAAAIDATCAGVSATAVRGRGRIARPAGAGRHGRIEHHAGTRMGQLHPTTVHARQIRVPSGPGRC